MIVLSYRTQQVTTAPALALPPSWPDDHSVPSRARHRIGVRRTKGECPVATQPNNKAVAAPPSYLHPAEVADLLHVSPKTVSRCKEGRLPFLKTLGGHRRYPEAEIRELADQLQVPTTTRAVDPALGSSSLHSGLAG